LKPLLAKQNDLHSQKKKYYPIKPFKILIENLKDVQSSKFPKINQKKKDIPKIRGY